MGKRKNVVVNQVSDESSDESDSDGGNDDSSNDKSDHLENINVEFEAQTPKENDFHGIKQLILRSIVLLHIDASELTDIILSQSSVGSTIKIVEDEDDEVYGIFSVISMKKYSEKQCIKELSKELLDRCKNCGKETKKKFEDILKNKNVGYLINERFINIPPQLAIPFHNSLKEEVEDEKSKDPLFDFDYLLLLSKTLKPMKPEINNSKGESSTVKSKKKKKVKSTENEYQDDSIIEYTNFEDEVFHKESTVEFSYSVTEATGFAVSGEWDLNDKPMKTYRTIMLVPANKWTNILSSIEKMVDT